MATVTRINGWRVFINSNDHRPAHVHVESNGTEAVFVLNCPNGPVELRDNWGVPQSEITWLEQMLAGVLSESCAKWRSIHGSYT
jgi:hypothetical protein